MARSAWRPVAALAAAGLGGACNADRIFQATPEQHGRPPQAPAELAQFRGDGAVAIAPGDTIGATAVLLRAIVADPDSGDTLRLEVELRAWTRRSEVRRPTSAMPRPPARRPS